MIKYQHRICDPGFQPATFAFDVPPACYFMLMIEKSEPVINFFFGMTLLHPKDQYTKSIGREYALKDLKLTPFYLDCIRIQNNRCRFALSTNIHGESVTIHISVDFKTQKVRMDYIELNKYDDY